MQPFASAEWGRGGMLPPAPFVSGSKPCFFHWAGYVILCFANAQKTAAVSKHLANLKGFGLPSLLAGLFRIRMFKNRRSVRFGPESGEALFKKRRSVRLGFDCSGKPCDAPGKKPDHRRSIAMEHYLRNIKAYRTAFFEHPCEQMRARPLSGADVVCPLRSS